MGDEWLTFLNGRLAPRFELRVVTLAPGCRLAFQEEEWRDALVVVEQGELELEGRSGGRRRFVSGDVLWLEGLALSALHNPGRDATLLAAVSRRRVARNP